MGLWTPETKWEYVPLNDQFLKMALEKCSWVKLHPQEDVKNYIEYFEESAISVTDLLESDPRTYMPFLTGAQQATERFNKSTRGYKITKRSTFRFSELKDQVTSVFIIPDVSRPKAQLPLMELLQYCFVEEMKRHPNKHVIVHIIADEAGNQKIPNLDELVTYSRGYGLRIQLYAQNIPALQKVYGETETKAIISECEIVIYLPGQRDIETLEYLVKMCGEGSYISLGHSSDSADSEYSLNGTNFQEEARPLMFADEIRRSNKAILFIRRNKPMLVDLPPIAAMHPFRTQIDVNPMHGSKPFLLPITLDLTRFKIYGRSFWNRLFKRRKREPWEYKYRYLRLSRWARFISRCFAHWPLFMIAAFFFMTNSPHVLVNYKYRQSGFNARYYQSCTYLGVYGFITPQDAGDCPWFINIDPREWK